MLICNETKCDDLVRVEEQDCGVFDGPGDTVMYPLADSREQCRMMWCEADVISK